MTLVSIPANPVPEDVVSGTIKTPDGAELRFARWAPPAGRKGTVCVFTGRSEHDREIFRDGARLARSRICGGDDRLARAGAFLAPPARSAQGLCPRLLRFRDRRRNLRAAGGAAGLPAALFRAGAFDGRGGHAAGGACGKTLVRPHGAVGADDRPAGAHDRASDAGAAAGHAADGAGRPLRARRQRRADRHGILHQQPLHQRSRALRPQRRDPGGRSDARHRLADGGLGRYRVQGDAYLSWRRAIRPKSASRS